MLDIPGLGGHNSRAVYAIGDCCECGSAADDLTGVCQDEHSGGVLWALWLSCSFNRQTGFGGSSALGVCAGGFGRCSVESIDACFVVFCGFADRSVSCPTRRFGWACSTLG